MNALNFSQLKQELGRIVENNVNSTIEWLGPKINDAYIDLCNTFRLDSSRRTSYLQITAPYTTGTVAVAAQGTAVTGTLTAFVAGMVGQKIVLNGQVYEIYSVTDATHLTLSRPYEGTTAITADATYVHYDTYTLPWGCDYTRILTATNPGNEQNLRRLTKEKFDIYFPNPTSTGDPVFLIPAGYWEDRYPKTEGGTVILAATSSATSAVLPAGAVAVDDHYNDWFLVNTTRNLMSRVTDYVGSTLTATVSPAITGQAATDVVYLKKRIPYVKLYPMPDAAQGILLTYFIEPDKMVNAYDVPWAIPDRYHRAIYLRAASHSMLIRDDARKREVDRDYDKILTEMQEEYNVLEGETFDKQSIDEDNRVDEPNLYKFPLGT